MFTGISELAIWRNNRNWDLKVSVILTVFCGSHKQPSAMYLDCVKLHFKISDQQDHFAVVTRFNSNTAQVTRGRITAQDVNAQSIYFPPCMVHLYQTLRLRHRLTHDARRQLTLFLKDIGMPIEEALDFWRNEYSQPSSECGSGCTHSWQKDARRYHYSIRHMYGLEGGRYTYTVPSCRSIQVIQHLH